MPIQMFIPMLGDGWDGITMFDWQPHDFDRNVVAGSLPTKVIRFTVYGEPRSKQRPRVTARGTYTPEGTRKAEHTIQAAWRQTLAKPFAHQVVASIDFFNGNKRRRDLDNMAKLVLDALNKVAYADDHQIVAMELRKFFCSPERARVEITLSEVIEWPHEHQIIQKVSRS
jgi:crossover junction endodeoxyribonuclease RusA